VRPWWAALGATGATAVVAGVGEEGDLPPLQCRLPLVGRSEGLAIWAVWVWVEEGEWEQRDRRRAALL